MTNYSLPTGPADMTYIAGIVADAVDITDIGSGIPDGEWYVNLYPVCGNTLPLVPAPANGMGIHRRNNKRKGKGKS